jgi:hypothetical protein
MTFKFMHVSLLTTESHPAAPTKQYFNRPTSGSSLRLRLTAILVEKYFSQYEFFFLN